MRRHVLRAWAVLWIALCVFTFFSAPAWDTEPEGGLLASAGLDEFLAVCTLALFAWPLGVGIILLLELALTRVLRSHGRV